MKVFFMLGLVSLTLAEPSKPTFHEHLYDFIETIFQESRDELWDIFEYYEEYEEFRDTFEYVRSAEFKMLLFEMGLLPEFQAVVDFMETNNIDMQYFVDIFHEMIRIAKSNTRKSRHKYSGTDFTAFTEDSVAVFPKNVLSNLYEQKMEEDDGFRDTMENFSSDEWREVLFALLQNESFKQMAQVLAQHGINLYTILDEVKAVFGQ